mgnify:CR=1 FL=1
MTRRAGIAILAAVALAAAAAPWIAPHPTGESFPGLLNAPPTRVRILDEAGRWRGPFIYPWTLVSQLEQHCRMRF